jgi:hypothetical protein
MDCLRLSNWPLLLMLAEQCRIDRSGMLKVSISAMQPSDQFRHHAEDAEFEAEKARTPLERTAYRRIALGWRELEVLARHQALARDPGSSVPMWEGGGGPAALPLSHYSRHHPDALVRYQCRACLATQDVPLQRVVARLRHHSWGDEQTRVCDVAEFNAQPCRQCRSVQWETRPVVEPRAA